MVMSTNLDPQSNEREEVLILRAAQISLLVSTSLLAIKFFAYYTTHSQAILSDALETVANVVAALLALVVLSISRNPADREHPYGRGKLEFFSAAFEGGLIFFASIMICTGALLGFFRGGPV